ncbi:SulP family inorganic anion transporter [Gracilimonas mengyeensis]|uniref:Sulfate permease, SulP family n=1 Tax=Gracilimonas mengyeensis TaxID=1302730 RepID=A0A521ANB3_9BACT|nr:sulfate permease [Gracilimonas mengyeensis]SMO36282.1 sulfate permease, SulP family [Gracilimonas mengyeensis]
MQHFLFKYFPILKTLKEYNLSKLKADAISGSTVGVVLIPQGMAYAVIAGLPPIYGLYAGLVPLLIYPLLGTSRHISIGPVAIDMLILAAALGFLAGNDPAEKVTLAVMIAAMTGTFQVVMGFMKLGVVFNLFSRPVISGFTIAAPIIIIASQLGTLLKIDIPNSQFIHEIAYHVFQQIGNIHWPSFGLSVFFILFLVLMRRYYSKLPESVILVAATILVVSFISVSQWGIQQVGAIPVGLPEFDLPPFDTDMIRELAPNAFTLSLIQFMTIASLSKSFARKHSYTVNPNQELVAIGASNIMGSLFQSLPVSSSFTRSAIAEQGGAETSLNNVFAAILILFTLLFLTPLFEILPEPLLGAIIVVSVSSLVDIKELRFLINTKRRDAMVAFITFVSVLTIGIQEGIIIGLVSSVIALLLKMSKPTVAELGLLPGTRDFKNRERFSEAQPIPGVLILRVDAAFSFMNAEFFKNYILEKSMTDEDAPKYVIIDGTTIGDLDVSAMDSLLMIIETLNKEGIELYISGLIGPVRDVLRKSDISTFVKSNRFFNTVHDGVRAALKKQDEQDQGSRLKEYMEICA